MSINQVFLVGVASYRLTKLISKEAGPFDVFKYFRSWIGVYDIGPDKKPIGFMGKMVECPFCLGIWISFLLWVIPKSKFRDVFVGFLGVAGFQAIMQAITIRLLGEE